MITTIKVQWTADELVDDIWPEYEQFGTGGSADQIFNAWKPQSKEINRDSDTDYTITINWWLPQSERAAIKKIKKLLNQSSQEA